MSTILERLYASSGPEVIISTLEIYSSATDPILICTGFEDITAVTEDGRTLTFIACNIDVALSGKNNKGSQSLAFAIDNTTGDPQRLIDETLAAGVEANATYRTYLSTDLSAPAEAPYQMVVRDGTLQGNVAQINLGFLDLIDVAWPRRTYNLNFAPGLKYL